MKKFSYIILLPLLLSCSLNNNLNTSNLNTNKLNNSFKIKGSAVVQENQIDYKGTWDTLNSSNYNGGSMSESNGVIENTNSSLVYSGSWTNFSNGAATASSFHYTNSENIFQLADNTSGNITYTRNSWLTYWLYTYNDISTPSKYLITNRETDINKIKYMYNGAYNVGPNSLSPKEESWSTSNMHLAWKTLTSSEGISYTESRESTSKIEIPFTGTNIQVFQYKTPNMGNCTIKVFDSNNNEVRSLTVNNNNASWLLAKTTITGLPNGNNKLVIQGIDGNRFNFVRAEVMPSIEYKFTGNNIIYNALKNNNCGRVAVTIDNDPNTTQVIDLYNSTAVYEDVYTKRDLGTGQHTITIDGLQEKNVSSSGFRMTVNEFKARPAVRGTFNGSYLNLKLVKLPSYGKADLYIDGVWNQEIDLYHSATQFFDLELTGLSDTNHSFYLEAKNTKNPSATGNRITFDAYTTNKAEYEFQGLSLYYYATKGPDKGMVDLYLDNVYQGRFDLYSATEQYKQEIFHVTGLSNTTHNLKLIPSGRKKWESTNYKVNFDYLQMDSTPRIIYSGFDGADYHIYVSYEDGSSSPLKISTGSGNGGSPAIAINGNQAVWTSSDGTNYYIKVGSTTNEFSPYIIDTSDTVVPNPSISQDGTKVVWLKNSGGAQVYVRNSDNSNSAIHISTTSTGNKDASFSPDGNKVLWVGTSGNSKVFVRNSDGSGDPTVISGGTLTNNAYPAFSYNGNKVVWKGSTGANYNIYTGNSDGTGSPVLISSRTANGSDFPMFSADGSKVTYSAVNSTYHIFVKNSDGSGSETQLSGTTTINNFPTFSPDGSKVAWHGRNGSNVFHIYVKNSDGSGSVTQISDSSTIKNFYPSFSPDGSKITWQGEEGGVNHVYVRSADGTGSITKLTSTTTENQRPLYEGSRNRYPSP